MKNHCRQLSLLCLELGQQGGTLSSAAQDQDGAQQGLEPGRHPVRMESGREVLVPRTSIPSHSSST